MEGFEGAIGADWARGAEGAEVAEWAEGVEGAEEDEWAAIYILLDGYDIMGIGYMALRGFGAKCRSGVDGVDGWVIPLRLLRLLEHLRC